MMLTHTWVEQYAGDKDAYAFLQEKVTDAVQFDCGDADEIPIAKVGEWAEARAPFPTTLLQFETPNSTEKSHILILWRENQNGRITFMGAERARADKKWRTIYPRQAWRNDDGSFHFEGYGYETSQLAVEVFFAMAMNLFYVMGCSNVSIVDNPAPASLNKKRVKAGKFPVLEHKTLVVTLNAPRSSRRETGGTHSSPRVHLRRGHVRRLESGRRVWVQSCVVGSKHGMVLKEYKITTAGAVGANASDKGRA